MLVTSPKKRGDNSMVTWQACSQYLVLLFPPHSPPLSITSPRPFCFQLPVFFLQATCYYIATTKIAGTTELL